MAAGEFFVWGFGRTCREAFDRAVAEAQSPTTGSRPGALAQKRSFRWLIVPHDSKPFAYAERLLEEEDPRVSDPAGPVGCILFSRPINFEDGSWWLFFGIKDK